MTNLLTNRLSNGVGKSLSDFNLTDAQVATAVAQIFVNDNPNNFTASEIWESLPWNVNAEHKVLPGYTFSSEIGDDDLTNKIVLDDHSGASIDVSGNTMDQTVFVGCKFKSSSKDKLTDSKVALLNCSFES